MIHASAIRNIRSILPSAVLLLCTGFPSHAQQRVVAVDSSVVSPVWSGHPVDFDLVAKGDTLYAAYYHGNTRQLIVSMRDPATGSWKHKGLTCVTPCTPQVNWDSHNYVTMAFDSDGLLHVTGNMHNNPIRYWRSDAPGEIDSLKHVPSMVGNLENSVTYPVFVKGAAGDLVFMYREGGSGNGNQIINKWNPGTKTWGRLLETNLFSGASTSGTRNVYFGSPSAGPVPGPDAYYHLFWFWRATPDAATTHRVSHMQSPDLVNWLTATGAGVTLPVTFDNNPGVIVDDVPQFAGLINRGEIGFDSQGRPVITYHKFESAGDDTSYTQLYNARFEAGQWVIYKTTDWPYRWDFGGGGSLVIQIQLGPVVLQPDGRLTQWYSHWQLGRGVLVLDEETLLPDTVLPDAYWPQHLDTAYRVANNGQSPLQMETHWLSVRSESDPSLVHALRWETWPENADQPRSSIPPAGQLMYYRMEDPNVTTSIVPVRARPGMTRRSVLRMENGRVIAAPAGKGPVDLRGRAVPVIEPRAK